MTLDVPIRVRYAETDAMGVAYHGHYFTWFEVARVELMRALGLRYRDLEAEGIYLPVVDCRARYPRCRPLRCSPTGTHRNYGGDARQDCVRLSSA